MTELTAAGLETMLAEFRKQYPPIENRLFSPFPSFKERVYIAPPPPPKIKVRDIKFSDGTSILPESFRADIDMKLLKRFGFQDDIFKDRAFILGDKVIMNARNADTLFRNLGP